MNVGAWKHHLVQYFDQQLVDLKQFGFPLDFHVFLAEVKKNHTSAVKFSQHVDIYIEEELSFQSLEGPFDDQPFALHISPLTTREKAGSDSKRTIN